MPEVPLVVLPGLKIRKAEGAKSFTQFFKKICSTSRRRINFFRVMGQGYRTQNTYFQSSIIRSNMKKNENVKLARVK